MKTNLWGITIAAATLLLLTSCQRDELQGGSISGEEVSVSISATMPIDGGAVVKSDTEPGDGSLANRCIMQIYYLPDESGSADPIPYGDRVTVAVSGMKALFPDQRLVSGHDYRFVFWADHVTDNSSAEALARDLHYDTEEFPIVSFKKKEDGTLSYSSNDDTRDAFFASYQLKVDGPSNHTVQLHRPFGQLNIIATDYGIVEDNFSTLLPTQVKIEFANIPSCINLLTGDLSEAVQPTLTSGPVAIANVTPAATDGSRQLSFDYIFAPQGDDQQLVLKDFKMFFLDNAGTEKVSHYTFQNIPVQRNYQTNVSGNLFTDRTGISVEVVPEFNEPALPEPVNDADELVSVLNNGGYASLAGDITIGSEGITLKKGTMVNINLSGHTLEFTSPKAYILANGSSVTITDGTIKSENLAGNAPGDVVDLLQLGEGGSLILQDVQLISNNAGIGFNSGLVDGAELIISNSTINCGTYTVSTNAAQQTENVKIVMSNSAFVSSTPFLINIPCSLEMSNCTVDGESYGVIMRGGDAVIENTRITLNYTDDDGDYIGDYFEKHDLDWGDGNMVNVAALTAGNKGAGYQYPTKVSLKNTVVEVTGPYADKLPAMYVWANEGEGLGVEITYDENTKFYGDRIYGNDGANITVNRAAAVSDEGDTRP